MTLSHSEIDKIRQAFTAPDGTPLIALDWDRDIFPLLHENGTVSFSTLQGNDVETIVQQILTLHDLNKATDIVFMLTVRESYCCKMSQMALLANVLCNIPSQPSIIWGYTQTPEQSENLRLNIILN